MKLQTCDPGLKAAFSAAGVSLNQFQEHTVAATAGTVDWAALLKALGNIAATLIPIIIGLFGGNTPPTPTPAPAKGAAHCCDHHACCCKALEAILAAARIEAQHLCECCCEC